MTGRRIEARITAQFTVALITELSSSKKKNNLRCDVTRLICNAFITIRNNGNTMQGDNDVRLNCYRQQWRQNMDAKNSRKLRCKNE